MTQVLIWDLFYAIKKHYTVQIVICIGDKSTLNFLSKNSYDPSKKRQKREDMDTHIEKECQRKPGEGQTER